MREHRAKGTEEILIKGGPQNLGFCPWMIYGRSVDDMDDLWMIYVFASLFGGVGWGYGHIHVFWDESGVGEDDEGRQEVYT